MRPVAGLLRPHILFLKQSFPFQILTKDRGIQPAGLAEKAGFSANILTRLKRDQYVSLDSIEKNMFCSYINEGGNRLFSWHHVLCSRYSVPQDNERLFMSQNMTYLPIKEQLRTEIERQKEIFYMQHPAL